MQDYDAGTTSTLEHLPAESTVAVLEAGVRQRLPSELSMLVDPKLNSFSHPVPKPFLHERVHN